MNKVDYRGRTSVGPSSEVWYDCPVLEMIADPSVGVHFMEHWLNPPIFASAVSQSGWMTYQDTSVTIQGFKNLSTGRVGSIQMVTPATDNSEGSIQTGGNLAGFLRVMTGTTGSGLTPAQTPGDLWYETSISLDSASLAENAMFIGLMEEGSALADILVDDTGALVSKDAIGFHCPTHASVAVLSCVYRKAGQAMVTVGAAQTMVLGTKYKLGMRFRFQTGVLEYLVDGVVVQRVTNLKYPATAPTTFPDGEELAPIYALKNGQAAAKKLTIDFCRAAMKIVA